MPRWARPRSTALRAHGFDDAAISSAVQVVAYFNYINRVADGLGVDLEDWIARRRTGSARWLTTEQGRAPEDEARQPEVEEKSVTKQYRGVFGGREVAYTATAATVSVGTGDDRRAAFFYVSYTEDGADPATRPVVFAFNGGPGSSTVWLHLGIARPQAGRTR